jgi:hypothetical protein
MAETARADRHGGRSALICYYVKLLSNNIEWRNTMRERSLEYSGRRLTSRYQQAARRGGALDGAAARRDDDLIRWNRFQPHVSGV